MEDIYFTGALTDPNKMDFSVEYKDDKGTWRRDTRDFVIRRKPEDSGRPGSRAGVWKVNKRKKKNVYLRRPAC